MQQLIRLIKIVSLLLLSLAVTCCASRENIKLVSAGDDLSSNTFENKIPILGVLKSDNRQTPMLAELLSLGLEIRPGSGQVYISLGAIQKVDTQVGLLLAHETTCDYLELPCHQYDFYYAFDLGGRTLVGGESASAAAAYLLAKTIHFEKMDPSIVVTGGLAPGAILARTDGVETKIELAQSLGFSKVYIPANTVCTTSPYCNGFKIDHQDCSIEGLALAGNSNTATGSVICSRKRNNEQSALKLTGCSTKDRQANGYFDLTCEQTVGGRDVRLEYNHCEQSCKSSASCALQCRSPIVHGFIDVAPVIGLQAMLLTASADQPAPKRPLPLNAELDISNALDDSQYTALSKLYRARIDHARLSAACYRITHRLQLTFQTLNRYRSSRFKVRVSHQQSLAKTENQAALCLLQGIQLEAEISVAKNFLDMGVMAKKQYLLKFLDYTYSKLPEIANNNYPLPHFYYQKARKSFGNGDLDAAFLQANKAIGFSSRELPRLTHR